MGDGEKELVRNSPASLEERLESPDNVIVATAIQPSAAPHRPGVVSHLLSTAHHQTLGRLYHQEDVSAASLDASVQRLENETPAQRLLLRNPREAAHLLLGAGMVGGAVIGYKILPYATGPLAEARLEVMQKAQPLIEVVSQHPFPLAAGAILAPAVLQRYARSRNSTLNKKGIAMTAALGGAAGLAVGEYGPQVIEVVTQFVQTYPAVTACGLMGAALPIVEYLRKAKEERGSKVRLALHSAAGAAVGVGASCILSLVDYGTRAAGPAILSTAQTVGQWLSLYYPELLGGALGSMVLPLVMNKWVVDDERNIRQFRYNATRLIGAAGGVGLVHYGQRVLEAATSLSSRVGFSLDVLVNALPEMGAFAAGAGTLLYLGRKSAQVRNKRWSKLAMLRDSILGGLGGIAFYQDPEMGTVMVGVGTVVGATIILATNPQLRQRLYSPFQSAGREIAYAAEVAWSVSAYSAEVAARGLVHGARVSHRYATHALSEVLDNVTPSEESIARHPNRHTLGLVAGGAGLAATAAFLEPIAGAVLPTLSLAELGVAGVVVGSILAVSEGVREYISGRGRR